MPLPLNASLIAAVGCMCMHSGHCMYFHMCRPACSLVCDGTAAVNPPAFTVSTSSKAMATGRCCVLPNGREPDSVACD